MEKIRFTNVGFTSTVGVRDYVVAKRDGHATVFCFLPRLRRDQTLLVEVHDRVHVCFDFPPDRGELVEFSDSTWLYRVICSVKLESDCSYIYVEIMRRSIWSIIHGAVSLFINGLRSNVDKVRGGYDASRGLL